MYENTATAATLSFNSGVIEVKARLCTQRRKPQAAVSMINSEFLLMLIFRVVQKLV